MKKLFLLAAIVLLAGCAKADQEDFSLVGTIWVGNIFGDGMHAIEFTSQTHAKAYSLEPRIGERIGKDYAGTGSYIRNGNEIIFSDLNIFDFTWYQVTKGVISGDFLGITFGHYSEAWGTHTTSYSRLQREK